MEMMLRKASRMLTIAGFVFLTLTLIAMIGFSFLASAISTAYLTVIEGGDATRILLIIKAVGFGFQLSLMIFLVAILLMSFSHIARSGRVKREQELEMIKEEIMSNIEERDNFEYVDLTKFKPLNKSRRKR